MDKKRNFLAPLRQSQMAALAILFLITSFTAHARANSLCENLLINSLSFSRNQQNEPIPGVKYKIQLHGDPRVQLLTYEGFVEKDNKVLVGFSEENRLHQVFHVFEQKQIAHWRPSEPSSGRFAKLVDSALLNASRAHLLSKFMFKPFLQLAKIDNEVEVVGDFTSSKKLGKKIAKDVRAFDQLMTSMGFARPKKTRIVVSGNAVLPNILGPFAINTPLTNIWSGSKTTSTIAMNPMMYRKNSVSDESILYHERTHTLLNQTYSDDAYVIYSTTIQEALADFAAAHMTNSPEIAVGAEEDKEALRDIEKRISGGSKRHSLMDAIGGSDHNNSMMISHILWKLRNEIGPDKMNEFFKPLVDQLNKLRPSYEANLFESGQATEDAWQNFVYDLEYVLAVILKTSQSWDSHKEVKQLIKNEAESLTFSFEKIQEVAENLKSSKQSFDFIPFQKNDAMILISNYGLTGFIVEASVVLWFSSLFI